MAASPTTSRCASSTSTRNRWKTRGTTASWQRSTAFWSAPVSAHAAFDRGLALWHGRALEDVADRQWAAFEAARLEDRRAIAIEDGLKRVSRGGTFLMFGVANTDAIAKFSPFRVYNDEIRIIGSMAVLHSFERALALLAKGVVDCEAMITNRFSLDQYTTAIDTFLAGSGLKVQVAP